MVQTLILASTLVAATPTADQQEWQLLTEEDDGIRVWRRDVPSSPAPELKAQAIFNLPAERIWPVVTRVQEFGEFMPYIAEVRVVGREDDGSTLVYFLIDPPLVSKRDYTMKTRFDARPDQGLWIRTWTLANERGPAPRTDVVRIEINDGSWHLERLGSQNTLVTYRVHSHPGGSIPDWMARRANTESLPDLIRNVRARSKDPAWTLD